MKIVDVKEVSGEGLEGLLGEEVLVFGMNYIYAGLLRGVNETCIRLDNARIVYETGPFTQAGYKDTQTLPGGTWYVARNAIESFGKGK